MRGGVGEIGWPRPGSFFKASLFQNRPSMAAKPVMIRETKPDSLDVSGNKPHRPSFLEF
jgi:hypothetical protein